MMIKQNKYFINDIQSTSIIKYIAKSCFSFVESFYYKSYQYLYKNSTKEKNIMFQYVRYLKMRLLI